MDDKQQAPQGTSSSAVPAPQDSLLTLLAKAAREALTATPVLGETVSLTLTRGEAEALARVGSGEARADSCEDAAFAEGGAYMLARVLELGDLEANFVDSPQVLECYARVREVLASFAVSRRAEVPARPLLSSHEWYAPGLASNLLMAVEHRLRQALACKPYTDALAPVQAKALLRHVAATSLVSLEAPAAFLAPVRIALAKTLLAGVRERPEGALDKEAAARVEEVEVLLDEESLDEDVRHVVEGARARGVVLQHEEEEAGPAVP